MARLDEAWLLGAWLILVAVALGLLLGDLRRHNREIMPLMRLVWVLTVLYSGPLGLAVYHWSGRKQIPRDGLWRRSARSTAHCYAGCGLGEIVGLVVTVGLLALGEIWVALTTFALAYAFGFGLTVGPLMQEGVGLRTALKDAFWSESASITVMELVAIGVGLWLAAGAGIGEVRFWTALAVSLSAGFVAAYWVNALLVHLGVKAGMHDPREMAAEAGEPAA